MLRAILILSSIIFVQLGLFVTWAINIQEERPYIQVYVSQGHCLAVLMKDGLVNNCYTDHNKSVSLKLSEIVPRYSELLLLVYDPTSEPVANGIIGFQHVHLPASLPNSEEDSTDQNNNESDRDNDSDSEMIRERSAMEGFGTTPAPVKEATDTHLVSSYHYVTGGPRVFATFPRDGAVLTSTAATSVTSFNNNNDSAVIDGDGDGESIDFHYYYRMQPVRVKVPMSGSTSTSTSGGGNVSFPGAAAQSTGDPTIQATEWELNEEVEVEVEVKARQDPRTIVHLAASLLPHCVPVSVTTTTDRAALGTTGSINSSGLLDRAGLESILNITSVRREAVEHSRKVLQPPLVRGCNTGNEVAHSPRLCINVSSADSSGFEGYSGCEPLHKQFHSISAGLPNGLYLAEWYLHADEEVTKTTVALIETTLIDLESGENVTLTWIETTTSVTTSRCHSDSMATRHFEVRALKRKSTIISVQSDARQSTESGSSLTDKAFPTFRILTNASSNDKNVLSVDENSTVMHVVLLSCRSLDRYVEAEVMLKSLLRNRRKYSMTSAADGMKRYNYRPLVIHIVTDYSGRVFFDNLWDNAPLSKQHHHQKLVKEKAGSMLGVVYHDYRTVCKKPLNEFLSALHPSSSTNRNNSYNSSANNTHSNEASAPGGMSMHHSGAAGYCRLFLPDYFNQEFEHLMQESDVQHAFPSIFHPQSAIITIESDQLILGPIDELWDMMVPAMSMQKSTSYLWTPTSTQEAVIREIEPVLVAAAENYQPWSSSRPALGAITNTTSKSARSQALLPRFNHSITTYHGYGIIGGIMVLNLAAIQSMQPPAHASSRHTEELLPRLLQSSPFLSDVLNSIRRYQREVTDEGSAVNNQDMQNNSVNGEKYTKMWTARLNDQDIFNVYLTEHHPNRLFVLPCQWNVQHHARLNTMVACAEDAIVPLMQQQQQQLDSAGAGPHVANGSIIDGIPLIPSVVPLNCDRSIAAEVFACECGSETLSPEEFSLLNNNYPQETAVKVLHYMAQSYSVDDRFLNYFTGYWGWYSRLDWAEIRL